MENFVKEVLETEHNHELTSRGTQSVMILRLAKAIERYNELFEEYCKVRGYTKEIK